MINKRIEEVTKVTEEDLISGVRLVFRNRNLMFTKISTRTNDFGGVSTLTFDLTKEEATHLKSLGARVKQYQGNYRIEARSFGYLADGARLEPPVVTNATGDRLTDEKIDKGIPNGTRADVYIWLKKHGDKATPRLSGIQVKPKQKVILTSRGFKVEEEGV